MADKNRSRMNIWEATKATEDLFAACPDVTVKIGDVEIDQNFFVQDEVSHLVIFGNLLLKICGCKQKCLTTTRLTDGYGAKVGRSP